MALPGGNYTAFSGLDLDLGPEVSEYEISPTATTFRLWSSPLVATKQSSQYDTESTECFTAMTFQTASIGKYNFNLEGKDELLWGANGESAFVNYHGEARSRFAIDWTTGEVTSSAPNVEKEEEDSDHDHEEGEAAPSFGSSNAPEQRTVAVLMVLGLSFLLYCF